MRLLKIDEVCELLNMNVNTVYSKIHKGEIKAIKMGKSYRVKSTELEALLDEKLDEHTTLKALERMENGEAMEIVTKYLKSRGKKIQGDKM